MHFGWEKDIFSIFFIKIKYISVCERLSNEIHSELIQKLEIEFRFRFPLQARDCVKRFQKNKDFTIENEYEKYMQLFPI